MSTTRGSDEFGDERRLGGRPGDQSGQPAPDESGSGRSLRQSARRAREGFRSRPAPRSAARTTGPLPLAYPLDAAPVHPHAEPVGDPLGDQGSRPGAGANEVDDLGSQLDRSAAPAP